MYELKTGKCSDKEQSFYYDSLILLYRELKLMTGCEEYCLSGLIKSNIHNWKLFKGGVIMNNGVIIEYLYNKECEEYYDKRTNAA